MTRAPWSMPKPAEGFPTGKWELYDTSLGWRYPNPRLAENIGPGAMLIPVRAACRCSPALR